MSLADDLLNLSSNGINSRLADMETEPHIVIGEDRFITVPDELKRIAVQYDHRVETVTFDCPRYWDGYDMSKMKIYINYTRADGLLGMYLAENVFADQQLPNIMHFDWTLTRNVTGINGPIVFMVCVKRVDRDGNEEVHWNSERNLEMYVSEGLEGEEVIRDLYPDIFTQMLQRMDEIEYLVEEKFTLIEGIRNEFVVLLDETKQEIYKRANEVEESLANTANTVLNRADEIEAVMDETQDMIEEVAKIATPEAMKNYTFEYYTENPTLVLDVIDELYSMAEDSDIDAIIGNTYQPILNNFEDKLSLATNPDIDAIISGEYVEVPGDDSGDDGTGDDDGGDSDMTITDEDIDNIVDDLFDGDDGENDDIEDGTGGITEEDIEDIVNGTF